MNVRATLAQGTRDELTTGVAACCGCDAIQLGDYTHDYRCDAGARIHHMADAHTSAARPLAVLMAGNGNRHAHRAVELV